jgi:hypothetical protein
MQADRLLRGFAGDNHFELTLCPIDPELPSAIGFRIFER